jgi:DMSO/TMAO reductase YedYZ heme-binding membrane subunit
MRKKIMHINQVITLLTFVVLALLLATGIYLVWDGSYGAFGILVMSLAVGFAGLLHLSFLEASNALADEQTREREWQEFKQRCSK